MASTLRKLLTEAAQLKEGGDIAKATAKFEAAVRVDANRYAHATARSDT